MVEVDVREKEVADVAELVAAFGEPGLQRRNAARGAAIEEGQSLGRVQKVRPDRPGRAAVQQVDRENVAQSN